MKKLVSTTLTAVFLITAFALVSFTTISKEVDEKAPRTAETTVEAETPSTGTWIAGTVDPWGYVLNEGTGGWTVERTELETYIIQGPPTAKIMVATFHSDFSDYPNIDVMITADELGDGRFEVYLFDVHRDKYALGSFSFIMYA